jgi:hypothetical protein
MPAVDIQVDEIQAWLPNLTAEQADQLIKGTIARAATYAPCILEVGFTSAEAAADIIRSAIRRRGEAGPGLSSSERVGDVQRTVDGRALPQVVFWDSEISELQRLCTAYNGVEVEGIGPDFAFPDSPLTDHRYRSALGIDCP